MPTLVLTPRFTNDSQNLWRAAIRLGWEVERLQGWRADANLCSVAEPVFHVEGIFGPALAQQFGRRLLAIPEDWLPRLPQKYRRRSIFMTTLGEARKRTEPAFIKPPNDKSFEARVYLGSELPAEYDPAAAVLVSEVVVWEREFRCFILDRQPFALSIYERDGQLQERNGFVQTEAEQSEALAFLANVLADPQVQLPRAAVLDIGVIAGQGWAVVEANPAWGSGLYGCDPEKVLAVLRQASVPCPG
ncbi:MAG: ATP-grasp domain-containing protein [Planctomycetota bacterium]